MSRRIASAPGKLVVAGEYAVLEGHPALVAAVDRRARVDLRRGADHLTVTGLFSSDQGQGHGPFRVNDTGTGVEILGDAHDTMRLVRAVLDELLRRDVPLPTGNLTLDSSALGTVELGDQALKLGLGSSAAAAAALVCAVAAEAGADEFLADPFPVAYAAHLAFSTGRGSGIDVAASSRGGLVRFRRTDDGPQLAEAGRLPSDLAVAVVFSGHSQDTRAFLDETNRLKQSARALYDDVIGEQAEATARFLDALDAQDTRSLIEAADQSRRAMQRLGEAAGIDIVSAPHQAIADAAASIGGSAKPSGAGGGDVALAFAPADKKDALLAALRGAGFGAVRLALGAIGPRSEEVT
jgi:phosphomevalonate kinase